MQIMKGRHINYNTYTHTIYVLLTKLPFDKKSVCHNRLKLAVDPLSFIHTIYERTFVKIIVFFIHLVRIVEN